MQELVERIKKGEYCFICENQGKIVGYSWWATNKKYIWEIQSTISIAADEAYEYNGYVSRNFRGQNVMPTLLHEGRVQLRKIGFKRSIGARLAWNYPAELPLLKSGFRLIGRVTVFFFLTFRFTFNTCRNMTLKNHGNILEFYNKLFQKMANAFKRS